MKLFFCLYEAKNCSIAIATIGFFNGVETKKNEYICGILWLYWYKALFKQFPRI
jgi:hypothetical protein